ncbi:transporter substrate-binding domain-containing protein [Desulfatiferula olefinivorans]
MIDIAVEVFGEKGYVIEYTNKPWNRAISECREGKIDAIVGAFVADVPDFVFPEIEQGVSRTLFWVKKGSQWKYDGINSLGNFPIGVIADYSYGEEFDNYVKKYKNDCKHVQVVFGDSALTSNINKLMKGRIEAFVEDMMVCRIELKKMTLSDEVQPAGLLTENNVYIAFSPILETSPAYAKILTEGMTTLRETGKLKTILDKYGLSDWK